MTAGTGAPVLLDIDLRQNAGRVAFDVSAWRSRAFAETRTAAGKFEGVCVATEDVVREPGWYLKRQGFWDGACGPAACWAGGAAGLLDYALTQARDDAHTMAHLGAVHAEVWGMTACLDGAGREIDRRDGDVERARRRALTVRHLLERGASEILRRLPRAYGPMPLATDEEFLRRYEELDLYVRQSHAERDLEQLGRSLRD